MYTARYINNKTAKTFGPTKTITLAQFFVKISV